MAEAVLHLASASPRRREILAALGVRHTWGGVDIDETPLPGEAADELALRLALGKAGACREMRADEPVILGADTVVTLDGRIFGKSATEDEALFMLSQLSGRTHRVVTAVALNVSGREFTAVSHSDVQMRQIEPNEALAYWRSGEPAGKAGAYAIQGLGGVFVAAVSGSYSGVVGLPVYETAGLLKHAGIDLLCITDTGRRGP
ncbi:MAG: nucleoside triphosphate pyrophosphatase [Woeseia sp.]